MICHIAPWLPDWLSDKIRLKAIKLFSCSTQLSTKFQLLINTKISTNKAVTLGLSDGVLIKLINVKMPTIVGISTFMSRINFVLS